MRREKKREETTTTVSIFVGDPVLVYDDGIKKIKNLPS